MPFSDMSYEWDLATPYLVFYIWFVDRKFTNLEFVQKFLAKLFTEFDLVNNYSTCSMFILKFHVSCWNIKGSGFGIYTCMNIKLSFEMDQIYSVRLFTDGGIAKWKFYISFGMKYILSLDPKMPRKWKFHINIDRGNQDLYIRYQIQHHMALIMLIIETLYGD